MNCKPIMAVAGRSVTAGLLLGFAVLGLAACTPHHAGSPMDAAVPDTGLPDTGLPDTAVPDTAVPDTGVPPTATARVIFGSAGNPSDLFVINDDGTGRVPLATTPDHEVFAGLSPNGRVIYSTTPVVGGSSDVASVLLDGTGTVTLAGSADNESFKGVTPSGRVVYKRDASGQSDLYSINDDGTSPATLANSADNEDFALPLALAGGLTQGITDSGKVVYRRTPAGGGASDIYIVDADGTGTVPLASTADDELLPYNTGGWVFYEVIRGGIYYNDAVQEDGTGNYELPRALGGPVAFEAGRVVTWGYKDPATVCFNSMNPDGSNEVELVCGSSGNTVQLTFKAASGGHIVYAGRLSGDLYGISVTGGAPVTLAASTENAAFQGITATGRVVYSSAGDLYSVGIDGTGKVPLAASADVETYRASLPDGRVVYERNPSGVGSHDIYIVNGDGSGPIPLASSADDEQLAGVSPSGRVLYLRNVGGSMHLCSVMPDGTGTVVLNAAGSVYYTSL